jgi:hypothetical protein
MNITKQYNKINRKYKKVVKTRNSKDAIVLKAEVIDGYNSVKDKLTQKDVDNFKKIVDNYNSLLSIGLYILFVFIFIGILIGLKSTPFFSRFLFSFDSSKRFTSSVLMYDAFALIYCVLALRYSKIFNKFRLLVLGPKMYNEMKETLDSIIISTNNFGD